jgi:hypothetical protein
MNLNIIRIRLKFEFESNFNAARYCKPQAHLSEPHASPTTAHLHRPRALPAAAPCSSSLRCAPTQAPTSSLFFSLCFHSDTASRLFCFPLDRAAPAKENHAATCSTTWRHHQNPPPGTVDLEPPSPSSSSIGERHHRPSSSSFPPHLTVFLPSRSHRSVLGSPPATAHRRLPPPH